MRIITERRQRGHGAPESQDWLDRLAMRAARLPGLRGIGARLRSQPGLRRALWFAALYAASVAVFALATFLLESLVPK
ncbi:MAG: hypothetical protein KGL12_01805 [Rhodospirillales bacterium]|nr:hypothetical protein [Rhodospirillales bacterium]